MYFKEKIQKLYHSIIFFNVIKKKTLFYAVPTRGDNSLVNTAFHSALDM